MSAEPPDSHAAPPSTRPARPREASIATGLLLGSACLLALLVAFAPAYVALIGAVPCCLTGAAGCLLMGRLNLPGPRGAEPWRLDAWGVALSGFTLLALGLSVGPETKTLGWLIVSLLVSLALAGFGSGRTR